MTQAVGAALARRFLQRLHAAVNAQDAEGVAALCTDAVAWDDPAAPHALHGRDAVLRSHRDTTFPALPDACIDLIDEPCLSFDGTGGLPGCASVARWVGR